MKKIRGKRGVGGNESGFDKLARLVKTEGEDIRSELQAFREETNTNFKELREEVRDIKRRLGDLEQKIGNVSGYSKEIDHILVRVAKIEKELGIVSK